MLFAVKNTNKDRLIKMEEKIISSVTFYKSVIKAIEKSVYSGIATTLGCKMLTITFTKQLVFIALSIAFNKNFNVL